jgi:hypothetical protein
MGDAVDGGLLESQGRILSGGSTSSEPIRFPTCKTQGVNQGASRLAPRRLSARHPSCALCRRRVFADLLRGVVDVPHPDRKKCPVDFDMRDPVEISTRFSRLGEESPFCLSCHPVRWFSPFRQESSRTKRLSTIGPTSSLECDRLLIGVYWRWPARQLIGRLRNSQTSPCSNRSGRGWNGGYDRRGLRSLAYHRGAGVLPRQRRG